MSIDRRPANELEAPPLPIYLDYQATTPVDPRVLEAMLPFFDEQFANPHSVHHSPGRQAARAIDEARRQIGALIGARPEDLYFTSGATEANNLAIRGVAAASTSGRRRVVCSAIEHPCVLACVESLAADGFESVVVPVDGDGIVDLSALEAVVDGDTLLVSVMSANNEIGVLQPLDAIGDICRSAGAVFHSDAAQSAGKIPIDVDAASVDMLSLSAHKMYGPKGIGALYLRRRAGLEIAPVLLGGGQERGLRSGTLPSPLCVGLGVASAISMEEMGSEAVRLRHLRKIFLEILERELTGGRLVGHPQRRLPGNLHLCFEGVPAEDLLLELDDLAMSTASACTTESRKPSHVLRAMGLPDETAQCCVRIGLGRTTTETEIRYAAQRLAETVDRLRDVGPKA